MRERRFQFVRAGVTAGLVALVCSALGGSARADSELPVLSAPTPRVRVDGWLREWPTNRFVAVGGETSGRMRFAFGANDRGLFVAASVDDDRMVRSARPSLAEDAIVVTIAGRGEAGVVTTEITLFAGVPNQTAATLLLGPVGARPTSIREASIVEMPTRSGYDLEAFVPWSAIPSARDYPHIRAVARLHDVDQSGGAARDVASGSTANPEAMPRVVGTAGELFPLTSFLGQKRATAADVETDVRANFAGDAAEERIVVVSGTLAIFGTGYSNGRDFDYADLGVSRGAITDLRALDFDRDGRAELVATVRRDEGRLVVREVRVFRFPGDRILPLLRAEIAVEASDGTLVSNWAIEPIAGTPTIRIDGAVATGNVPRGHNASADVVPITSASTGLRNRRIGITANGYNVLSEEREQPPVQTANSAPPPRSNTATPRTTTTTTSTPPPPARPAFDGNAMLAAVRRDRHIASNVSPRFTTSADIAEDSRAETVAVLDRTVVLYGAGYRQGLGYFAIDLSVATPDDVTGISAADVTGDGKAEIWARVRQPIGGNAYSLELLVIYRVDANGVAPIFTAQMALSDATRSVRNEARVVGSGRSLQLALSPGRAQGFDARTFPFATTATAGMTSLLLPWRDREQRYRWDGRAIVGP